MKNLLLTAVLFLISAGFAFSQQQSNIPKVQTAGESGTVAVPKRDKIGVNASQRETVHVVAEPCHDHQHAGNNTSSRFHKAVCKTSCPRGHKRATASIEGASKRGQRS